MPSITHQALVEMFRSRPTLAVELLRGALHIAVPLAPVIAPVEASLDDLVPTEHRADLVLALRADDDTPAMAVVIVEVQLGRDADKPWTWPLYLAVLRERHRCPVWLLVVAPAEEIATWAASPLEFAPGNGAVTPVVLGPGMIPWVTDAAAAKANPELALLSAAAHCGDEKAAAILDALPMALAELPRDMLPGYLAMLYALLAPALRKRLEVLMTTASFADVELPPFIQKIVDKGRVEGRVEDRAAAILELMELRGLSVTDTVRAEVLGCHDLPTLEHWFRRAATMKSARAVVRSRPKA